MGTFPKVPSFKEKANSLQSIVLDIIIILINIINWNCVYLNGPRVVLAGTSPYSIALEQKYAIKEKAKTEKFEID